MKKLIGTTLALALISSTVFAFGLPKLNSGNSTVNSVVNTAVDQGKNKAIESEINKVIKQQNCSFRANSSETTCDLHKVISTIESKRSTLQSLGLVNGVTINIISHGPMKGSLMSDRNDHVYNALWSQLSWPHYNKSTNRDESNALDISVSVR